jgi:tetratricopeptide (TPR) repeat protein/transcriptional regulator with XRE-family HTH domain
LQHVPHHCSLRAFFEEGKTMEKSALASFGELLKAYRKRQKVTQQQLARMLALHHNTVGAWERGDYLPATRGTILELARSLHLDEGETRDLLEASLITVTPRWSVPYQRNPFFTGRHEILLQLHVLLHGENITTTRSCALSGLGGIGKTQTAIEYAYQHSLDYSAVFWVSAETEANMLSSFAAIARMLKLPVHYIQKQDDVIASVLDWLNTHQNWLLIFDNAHDITLIKRFLPSSQIGSLLFTTRLPTLGTLALPIELQSLSLEESVQLLLHRAGMQPPHRPSVPMSIDDEMTARAIGEALDGLPLALDQAAAYIEESHCSLTGFLHLFRYNTARILQEHPASATYPHSVEKTFTLAFERLQRQDPAAADLLTLCCFLAPDEIPEALLIKGAAYLTEELQAVFSEPFRLNETFKHLLSYALLRRNTQAQTLSIHRLVQTVLKEQLPEEVQHAWVERLIRMLDHLFLIEQDRLNAEHWAWDEQLLPHTQRIFQLADHLKLASLEFGSLLRKTATYLFHRARYNQAETLYLQAITIQKQVLGASHSDLALALAGLANTHLQQGRYQEVETFYQQAISLLESSLGPEHLQLAPPLQGLAFFYQETTQYEKAEALYQRALRVCTQALGSDHPDVATALYNLAACYLVQGYSTQAEPLYLQALHIRERTLPPHHPDIATSLNDLAILYYYQARYQEAEHLYLRSLSLNQQALGVDHPDVATILNNLALLYYRQARYEQAESLYQRALHIREQIFGADHPYTAFFANNLAALYCDQERYKEAEAFASRALAIYEQKLDASSHITANPLQNLAQLAYKQGRYTEAEALSSRALAILERTLPDHYKLAETLHLHANVRRKQGFYEEAELLYQRALSVYRKALGPEHINIAMLMDDIATLYLHQSQREKAEQHYQKALRIWARYQELNHPAHAACLEHFAALLQQQQRLQEANSYYLQAQEMRAKCVPVAFHTAHTISL